MITMITILMIMITIIARSSSVLEPVYGVSGFVSITYLPEGTQTAFFSSYSIHSFIKFICT